MCIHSCGSFLLNPTSVLQTPPFKTPTDHTPSIPPLFPSLHPFSEFLSWYFAYFCAVHPCCPTDLWQFVEISPGVCMGRQRSRATGEWLHDCQQEASVGPRLRQVQNIESRLRFLAQHCVVHDGRDDVNRSWTRHVLHESRPTRGFFSRQVSSIFLDLANDKTASSFFALLRGTLFRFYKFQAKLHSLDSCWTRLLYDASSLFINLQSVCIILHYISLSR